jgi:hypothetical protein
VKARISLFTLIVAIVVSVGSARANDADSGIITRDYSGCATGNCVPIKGRASGLSALSAGFGIEHYLHVPGSSWTGLTHPETFAAAINVTCDDNVFSCGVVRSGQNGAKIVLTAMNGSGRIRRSNSFDVVLDCKNADCPHWQVNSDTDAVTSSVPEPAGMTLILTGLVGLLARRKRIVVI